MEATSFWLDKHGEKINSRFPKSFLLEALKLILDHNTFLFNGQNYLQISGTAMGTKVAPTYATLVMGFIENRMYQIMEVNFDQEFSEYIKYQWKRYLDDCFIIWNKSENDLLSFHNILNSIHQSIKFTIESNNHELPFLDILVIKTDSKISTDIYFKNTDTHQYLNLRSCHPSHIKRNIPFCLARRLCTIVSDMDTRNLRLEELRVYLKKQNYPISLINAGIEKAKAIPISKLRTTVRRERNENVIPFVSTHNPHNPNIFGVIKASLPILHGTEQLKTLYPEQIMLKSKRQPKNLKKILTRARFNGDQTHTYKVSTCNDKRCGLCKFINIGTQLTLSNGKIIRPNSDFNCGSENLIYCVVCDNCNETYIGQTGNSLRERFRVHRQQIRDPTVRQIDLSEHLDICSRGKYKVFPFYKMNEQNEYKRLARETHFIKIFEPKLNNT